MLEGSRFKTSCKGRPCCRREAKIAAYQLPAENQIDFGPEYLSFREARRRLSDHASGSETPEEA